MERERKWRENEKMEMQWREREDMEREEISVSPFLPLSVFPYSLSIFSLHFLSIFSFARHFLFILSFCLPQVVPACSLLFSGIDTAVSIKWNLRH